MSYVLISSYTAIKCVAFARISTVSSKVDVHDANSIIFTRLDCQYNLSWSVFIKWKVKCQITCFIKWQTIHSRPSHHFWGGYKIERLVNTDSWTTRAGMGLLGLRSNKLSGFFFYVSTNITVNGRLTTKLHDNGVTSASLFFTSFDTNKHGLDKSCCYRSFR
jgi:hypothetical protein